MSPMDTYISPHGSSMPIQHRRADNVVRLGSAPVFSSKLNNWLVQRVVKRSLGSASNDSHDEYVLSSDGLTISFEIFAQEEQIVASSKSLDLGERLNGIKETLGLSVTQIAELFNVTRKSVYDWYEGVEPRSSKANRIEALIDVLQNAPVGMDLRRVKFVWNIPVAGDSFLSVLNDDRLDSLTLKTKLSTKLNELATRLATTETQERNRYKDTGDASLAEFDRFADLS